MKAEKAGSSLRIKLSDEETKQRADVAELAGLNEKPVRTIEERVRRLELFCEMRGMNNIEL